MSTIRIAVTTQGLTAKGCAQIRYKSDGRWIFRAVLDQKVSLTLGALDIDGQASERRGLLGPTIGWAFDDREPLQIYVPSANIEYARPKDYSFVNITATVTGIPIEAPHFAFFSQPFDVQVAGYLLRLIPAARNRHTIAIQNVAYQAIGEIKQLLTDLMWLLSLATGSLCGLIEVVVRTQSRKLVLRTLYDGSQRFRTEPYLIPSEETPKFLETAYPYFQKLSHAYSLTALIN